MRIPFSNRCFGLLLALTALVQQQTQQQVQAFPNTAQSWSRIAALRRQPQSLLSKSDSTSASTSASSTSSALSTSVPTHVSNQKNGLPFHIQVFALGSNARSVLQDCWWSLPLWGCSIPPVYSWIKFKEHAAMPHWWQVFDMHHIVARPDAVAVVGFFLLSNLVYFLAAAYLLAKFPPEIQKAKQDGSATGSATTTATIDTTTAASNRRRVITRHTGLALSIAAAGVISTIFHSVQALGNYRLAQGLCYLDHGIAASSILYFFDVLGWPDKTTATLSAAGLVTLIVTNPGYAWLHSTWHFLSAAAAISWATQAERAVVAPYVSPEESKTLVNPELE